MPGVAIHAKCTQASALNFSISLQGGSASVPLNHVILSPGEISQQLRKRVAEPMFNDVQEAFDAWGIAPTSVKFLCLTGGTSYIPVFEETLREKLMLQPENTRRVQVLGHARLNVVAGAARRPGLRIPGLLPLALSALLGDITSAAARVRTCVGELRKAPVVVDVADAARVAASLALELGDDQNAAVLLEAFVRILHDAGMPLFLDAHWQRTHETMTEGLNAKLGEESFARARAQGAKLTVDEVLDLSLSVAS